MDDQKYWRGSSSGLQLFQRGCQSSDPAAFCTGKENSGRSFVSSGKNEGMFSFILGVPGICCITKPDMVHFIKEQI